MSYCFIVVAAITAASDIGIATVDTHDIAVVLSDPWIRQAVANCYHHMLSHQLQQLPEVSCRVQLMLLVLVFTLYVELSLSIVLVSSYCHRVCSAT